VNAFTAKKQFLNTVQQSSNSPASSKRINGVHLIGSAFTSEASVASHRQLKKALVKKGSILHENNVYGGSGAPSVSTYQKNYRKKKISSRRLRDESGSIQDETDSVTLAKQMFI